MSMSQEEIESLMNDLNFEEKTISKEPVFKDESATVTSMSEDDINELIIQTEDIVSTKNKSSEESIDKLLNSLEENMSIKESVNQETNIDEIIKKLEETNSSTQKSIKIFDIFSHILNYNNNIRDNIDALNEFNNKQITMLLSLNNKFPNIEAFKINLEQAKKMESHINNINKKLNDENIEISQIMELIQYYDINKQKIEKIISVIRKLSIYLNNFFGNEEKREVMVANYTHKEIIKDLEVLIVEFNKK